MKYTTQTQRKAATEICKTYLPSVYAYDDIVDIRKQKVNFEVFSCRIIGDRCVIIIANYIRECKDYLKYCVGGIQWIQANSLDWQDPFNSMNCYAGLAYTGKGTMRLVLYQLTKEMSENEFLCIKELYK